MPEIASEGFLRLLESILRCVFYTISPEFPVELSPHCLQWYMIMPLPLGFLSLPLSLPDWPTYTSGSHLPGKLFSSNS